MDFNIKVKSTSIVDQSKGHYYTRVPSFDNDLDDEINQEYLKKPVFGIPQLNFEDVETYEDHIKNLINNKRNAKRLSSFQLQHLMGDNYKDPNLDFEQENSLTQSARSKQNPWKKVAQFIFSPGNEIDQQYKEYIKKKLEMESKVEKFPFKDLLLKDEIQFKKMYAKSLLKRQSQIKKKSHRRARFQQDTDTLMSRYQTFTQDKSENLRLFKKRQSVKKEEVELIKNSILITPSSQLQAELNELQKKTSFQNLVEKLKKQRLERNSKNNRNNHNINILQVALPKQSFSIINNKNFKPLSYRNVVSQKESQPSDTSSQIQSQQTQSTSNTHQTGEKSAPQCSYNSSQTNFPIKDLKGVLASQRARNVQLPILQSNRGSYLTSPKNQLLNEEDVLVSGSMYKQQSEKQDHYQSFTQNPRQNSQELMMKANKFFRTRSKMNEYVNDLEKNSQVTTRDNVVKTEQLIENHVSKQTYRGINKASLKLNQYINELSKNPDYALSPQTTKESIIPSQQNVLVDLILQRGSIKRNQIERKSKKAQLDLLNIDNVNQGNVISTTNKTRYKSFVQTPTNNNAFLSSAGSSSSFNRF